MTIRVEHADMLEAIPRLVAEGVVCDAVVTDPPYHLTSVARGQTPGSVAASKDVFLRVKAGGFMGQGWDGGDIAFRPETWATVATILRPGAFLVAFGGTRTYHRMVCAIEDGGFVIQDTIAWLYGSGFPKRRDMLKPAFEPIVLAYKPGGKRTMQIDECRIEARDNTTKAWRGAGDRSREQYRTGTTGATIATDLGRWPANCVHDGSDEVMAAFDVAGERSSGFMPKGTMADRTNGFCGGGAYKVRTSRDFGGDTGSAARFFFSAKAGAEDRWGSLHPTVKPVDLIAWLVKLVCPPNGLFLDPFAGSGSAAVAALRTGRNAILIEREDQYIADIRERIAFYEGEGRHSLAAKARRSPEKPIGGLFAGAA